MRDIEIVDHDEIRELRLARPPVNALSPDLLASLTGAIDDAPRQGALALVLSGSRGLFSAGLDVPHLLRLDRPGMHRAWSLFLDAMRALATSEIPVIAAITGHCPAGGLVLALFCDGRVMARGEFQIGLNEVQVGIPLPTVIYQALTLVVGRRRAEELAVSGALVAPEEALRLGLVDELGEPEAVVGRALARCRTLLSLPPRAMAETRRWARGSLAALFDDIDEDAVDDMLERCWYHPEAQATLAELVRRLGKE